MLESKLWYIKTVRNDVKGTKMVGYKKRGTNTPTSLILVTFSALS